MLLSTETTASPTGREVPFQERQRVPTLNIVDDGLHRYWFEFEGAPEGVTFGLVLTTPPWKLIGVGVTGFDETDCRAMISEKLLRGGPMPPLRRVVRDIDMSTLDERHVLPNMGVAVWRGIWFPEGYQD